MEILGHGSIKCLLVSEMQLTFSIWCIVVNLNTNYDSDIAQKDALLNTSWLFSVQFGNYVPLKNSDSLGFIFSLWPCPNLEHQFSFIPIQQLYQPVVFSAILLSAYDGSLEGKTKIAYRSDLALCVVLERGCSAAGVFWHETPM